MAAWAMYGAVTDLIVRAAEVSPAATSPVCFSS
jgi:hypothetical protein